MGVREEYNQSNTQFEMVEHLSTVVGHVEETNADQYAAHHVMYELDAKTWKIKTWGCYYELDVTEIVTSLQDTKFFSLC